MPSPIGHALGGALVAAATLRPGLGGWGLGLGNCGLLVVLAAVVPDVDFLWGGHNRQTHSLGAALIAGLAVWAWRRNPRVAIAVTLAWSTHVLFDWLGSDDTPPIGVMALWPLSSDYYFANAFVFEAISRRYWLDNFVSHNAWAVFKEVLLLGPVAAALWAWRGLRTSKS